MKIPDGKAEKILNSLVQFFREKDVSMSKVSSLASDGANVTVGRRNGVGAQNTILTSSKYTLLLIAWPSQQPTLLRQYLSLMSSSAL